MEHTQYTPVDSAETIIVGYDGYYLNDMYKPGHKNWRFDNLEKINKLTNINVPVVDIQHAYDYSLALASVSGINIIVEYWCKQYSMKQMAMDIMSVIIMYFVQKRSDSMSYVLSIGGDTFGGNGHGYYQSNWTKIKALDDTNIIKIRTGFDFSLFLDSDGVVFAAGNNDFGQLGFGHFLKKETSQIEYFVINKIKIKDIECGNCHSLAVDYNHKIYSWGRNNNGQCGNPSKGSYINKPRLISSMKRYKIKKIDCGDVHSYCMTFDGDHYLWGINHVNECLLFGTDTIVYRPHCINNIIIQKTNGKSIKSVSLSCCLTKITVSC